MSQPSNCKHACGVSRWASHLRQLSAAAAVGLACSASHGFYSYDNVSATVQDTVVQTATDTWSYAYAVTNTTHCFGNCLDTVFQRSISDDLLAVRSFVVPYFDDASITAVTSPAGWNWTLSDPIPHGGGTLGSLSLAWYVVDPEAAGVSLNSTLSGFGYTAAYGPAKGPFAIRLGNNDLAFGDPAVPLSPKAEAAGLQPLAVPEPAAALLLLVGLVAVGGAARRGGRAAA